MSGRDSDGAWIRLDEVKEEKAWEAEAEEVGRWDFLISLFMGREGAREG